MKSTFQSLTEDAANSVPALERIPVLDDWFRAQWKFAVERARARGVRDPEQLVLNAVITAWIVHKRTGLPFKSVLGTRLFFDPKSAYKREVNDLPTVELLESHADVADDREEDERIRRERRGKIAAALRQLPPGKRRLLWLHFWRDLSYAEIALRPEFKDKGITKEALRCRVSRAYDQLRALLPSGICRGQ